MLGAYYTGQFYTGQSDYSISNILFIQDSLHSVLGDSTGVTQKHVIAINGALHDLLDGGASAFPALLVDGTEITITDEVSIIQEFFLAVATGNFSLSNDIASILIELTEVTFPTNGYQRGGRPQDVELQAAIELTDSYSKGHNRPEVAMTPSDNPTGDYTVADSDS